MTEFSLSITEVCKRTPLFLFIHMKQLAFPSLLSLVWGKFFFAILDMGHQSGGHPKLSVINLRDFVFFHHYDENMNYLSPKP